MYCIPTGPLRARRAANTRTADLSYADAAGLLGTADLKAQLLAVDPRWYGPDVPHALTSLARTAAAENAVARVPELPALLAWLVSLAEVIAFYHEHTCVAGDVV